MNSDYRQDPSQIAVTHPRFKKHDTILEKYAKHVIYEKVKIHNKMKKLDAFHKYPNKKQVSRNQLLDSMRSSNSSNWFS